MADGVHIIPKKYRPPIIKTPPLLSGGSGGERPASDHERLRATDFGEWKRKNVQILKIMIMQSKKMQKNWRSRQIATFAMLSRSRSQRSRIGHYNHYTTVTDTLDCEKFKWIFFYKNATETCQSPGCSRVRRVIKPIDNSGGWLRSNYLKIY